MPADDTYDGIIIGAGHNGLILQAYLCRAGLKVLSVDRRHVAGGGLSTMEDPSQPGFLHNTHSFYHRALTRMPWYRDLDLHRFGARYVEPELNVALILESGDSLEWWTEFEKTRASFARFSERDAETLTRWREAFEPIVRNILVPESQAPPIPSEERERLLAKSRAGRQLLDASRLSPEAFVRSEFENPVIQAGLLFFNGLREVDLRSPGFGHHIPFLLASPGKAQMCLGGSANLGKALARCVEASGGRIRLQTELSRIVVEGGRAVGIETTDGDVIRARRFVASSLNPQQTFLDLLSPDELPESWEARAEGFRYNTIAPLFGLNLSLSEPPRWRAAEDRPELDRAFMVILGLDHIDRFVEMVDAHEEGRIPPAIAWGTCPTLFDPTQAPPGRHTMFLWQKLPYALNGDAASWDHERDRVGEGMFDLLVRHAPNVAKATIGRFVRSPLDTERTLPNMAQGDLLVGSFERGQVGFGRPFEDAGSYRVKPDGLYLCGSCCHPGGNVTGLPGYNCAQVLTRDLGLSADWSPGDIRARLSRL